MRRSNWMRCRVMLCAALLVGGSAAWAAAPEQPSYRDTLPRSSAEATLARALVSPEVAGSSAPLAPAGTEPANVEFEPCALRLAVGSPCCVTLCQQICGGEACLCKQCQVLACGL